MLRKELTEVQTDLKQSHTQLSTDINDVKTRLEEMEKKLQESTQEMKESIQEMKETMQGFLNSFQEKNASPTTITEDLAQSDPSCSHATPAVFTTPSPGLANQSSGPYALNAVAQSLNCVDTRIISAGVDMNSINSNTTATTLLSNPQQHQLICTPTAHAMMPQPTGQTYVTILSQDGLTYLVPQTNYPLQPMTLATTTPQSLLTQRAYCDVTDRQTASRPLVQQTEVDRVMRVQEVASCRISEGGGMMTSDQQSTEEATQVINLLHLQRTYITKLLYMVVYNSDFIPTG